MLESDVICKILFRSKGSSITRWILGVVEKKQLFSPESSFITVKNYGNKVIGKQDILEIRIYKEAKMVIIDKRNLTFNKPVSMES